MGSTGNPPVPVGDWPSDRAVPQLRRSDLFVADGSHPAKSPVGAASSASMPLLRSFDFLPFAIYNYAAPMGLGKPTLALNSMGASQWRVPRKKRISGHAVSQGKGERDRLGRTRRRLADGIRTLHCSPLDECLPHIVNAWGGQRPARIGYLGFLTTGGGFFFRSFRISSMPRSSCGSPPLAMSAGSSTTLISGSTP